MQVFFVVYLIPVVLLDTTTVLGELGWKTYPLNGVSLNIFQNCYSVGFLGCIIIVKRTEYCSMF